MVGTRRRSGAGRRMLAVRDNERAAAVAGVNVAAVKLQAFRTFGLDRRARRRTRGVLIRSSLRAIRGTPSCRRSRCSTVAYIGGIASISGAVMAGVIAVGGLVYVFVLKEIGDLGNYYILVSGIGLI